MNKNSGEKKETRNGTGTWAKMVTNTARMSVIAHAAVFAVVNTMLVAVNMGLGHKFIEWPVAPWAMALVIHTAVVALAPEVARVRVRINRLNLSFPAN